MKVFKVSVDTFDYDEYDACIVVAESKEDVESMFIKVEGNSMSDYTLIKGNNPNGSDDVYFDKYQGEIHIEEVDLTKKGLILASFNAG